MTADVAVERFRGLLAIRLGWAFPDNERAQLAQELDQRARERGLDHDGYLTRLGAGGWPGELSRIAEDLTITETYFFRHGEQFRALAEVALPERLAAREPQRALRMLSVGCSSGEEPYTLAIVAHEALRGRDDAGPEWIVSVRGLDANPEMLRRAARGRYSAWALRETPDAVRQRWFHPAEAGYEVDPQLRSSVRWQRYNVADEDPVLWRAGQYDVIFCRNLLMYLTPATAGSLVRRMTRALAPGGYLFLGHTDSLGSGPEGLESRHSHSAFYYRRAVGGPPPAMRAEPPAVPRTPPPEPAASPRYEHLLGLAREERFAEALAESERRQDGRAAPRDLLLHGVLLAQAGRPAEAEMAARRLLDIDGLCADAHHLLGVCLEDDAAVDVAIGHYRLAAYLDPAFAMPRLRIGLLARRRGDDRSAAPELDRALHLLRAERDDRIVLFGGGFGRIALAALCRAERDACGVRR